MTANTIPKPFNTVTV